MQYALPAIAFASIVIAFGIDFGKLKIQNACRMRYFANVANSFGSVLFTIDLA